jgi:hypothetical protein
METNMKHGTLVLYRLLKVGPKPLHSILIAFNKHFMRLQTTMMLKALQALFLHSPSTLRLLLSSSSFVNDFQDQANFFSVCRKNNTFFLDPAR